MNKKEIVEQTKIAYDFLQKLFFEVSYLIKEMEGLLGEETPKFEICRPTGYHINTRSSNGLDTNYVPLWLLRKFSVAFRPKDTKATGKGPTITALEPDKKIIYVRIVLNDKDLIEPTINTGILYDFHKRNVANQRLTKIEQLLTTIEYSESKIFANPSSIEYEDANVSFKGRFFQTPLYDIDSSEALNEKIIQRVLKLYSEISVM